MTTNRIPPPACGITSLDATTIRQYDAQEAAKAAAEVRAKRDIAAATNRMLKAGASGVGQ